jgi:acetoin utilization deacetylase AcuC-like enzyme
MKIVFHEDFYPEYTYDAAAVAGRMESIVDVIRPMAEFIEAEAATEAEIRAVHTEGQIERVKHIGLFPIAALAAGGAIQAARIGLKEPAFALIRPPGHHASAGHSWGFCYFNNLAIALVALYHRKQIQSALILDIDLHFGDGTVNILGECGWVSIHNPSGRSRDVFLNECRSALTGAAVDIIAVSAGFDRHCRDWGGLLETEDYTAVGRMVAQTARTRGAGCFAVLEGGYNQDVLGYNAAALLEGMTAGGHNGSD